MRHTDSMIWNFSRSIFRVTDAKWFDCQLSSAHTWKMICVCSCLANASRSCVQLFGTNEGSAYVAYAPSYIEYGDAYYEAI